MKNFKLVCRCGYTEFSTGLSKDLAHLKEVKKCANCGGPRLFKCPKCSNIAKLYRIKGNT